jgi:hypothetical protein
MQGPFERDGPEVSSAISFPLWLVGRGLCVGSLHLPPRQISTLQQNHFRSLHSHSFDHRVYPHSTFLQLEERYSLPFQTCIVAQQHAAGAGKCPLDCSPVR